jgi:hypothetical protein
MRIKGIAPITISDVDVARQPASATAAPTAQVSDGTPPVRI